MGLLGWIIECFLDYWIGLDYLIFHSNMGSVVVHSSQGRFFFCYSPIWALLCSCLAWAFLFLLFFRILAQKVIFGKKWFHDTFLRRTTIFCQMLSYFAASMCHRVLRERAAELVNASQLRTKGGDAIATTAACSALEGGLFSVLDASTTSNTTFSVCLPICCEKSDRRYVVYHGNPLSAT